MTTLKDFHLTYGIVSAKRDLTCFFKISNFFQLYSRSLKCSLHITSYALRIGVSITEFYLELNLQLVIHFNASVTFLLRVTGNFIMYALGPFYWKQSLHISLLRWKNYTCLYQTVQNIETLMRSYFDTRSCIDITRTTQHLSVYLYFFNPPLIMPSNVLRHTTPMIRNSPMKQTYETICTMWSKNTKLHTCV